jgi:pyruvoyl-dependent arginine decarboxylase (PvlArgDC)
MIILGNRVPYEYFITSGKGESSAGSAGLPYETGSYDAALNDAGIQNGIQNGIPTGTTIL